MAIKQICLDLYMKLAIILLCEVCDSSKSERNHLKHKDVIRALLCDGRAVTQKQMQDVEDEDLESIPLKWFCQEWSVVILADEPTQSRQKPIT
jgi:hypothetical protein